MTDGRDAFVVIVVVLLICSLFGGMFAAGKYYGDRKNIRENATVVKCIEQGRSPIECRLAIKGRLDY